MEKLHASKTCLKTAGERGDAFPHPPLDPPLPAPITSLFHYANQPVCFQYDVGQILSQLFWNDSTYCTCTVWKLHLKKKDLVLKEGGRTPTPTPLCAILRYTSASKRICINFL